MSTTPEGPGWWLASDGRYYPPSEHPGRAPRRPGAGSLVLNVLWLFLSGIWLAFGYLVSGVVLCILLVTIPFGIQCFKLAGFALWPFGRTVVRRPGANPGLTALGNLVWLVLVGFWMALAHVITGVLLCLTVVGIPLGLGNFKLVPMVLLPFGRQVVRRDHAGLGS